MSNNSVSSLVRNASASTAPSRDRASSSTVPSAGPATAHSLATGVLAAHQPPEPKDLRVPGVQDWLDDVHRGVHGDLGIAGNAVAQETASERPPEPFRRDGQQIGRFLGRLVRTSRRTSRRRYSFWAIRHREQRCHRPRLRLSRGGAPPLWYGRLREHWRDLPDKGLSSQR